RRGQDHARHAAADARSDGHHGRHRIRGGQDHPLNVSLGGEMRFIRLTAPAVVRALAALCLVAAATTASAQSTGQIAGTIKDTSGGVLPGVTVTVTNVGTNIARTAVTDENGSFVVTSLAVGTYKVAAELQGFKKAERSGFELSADSRLTADFSLGVGSMTETVEVTVV